MGRHHYPHSWAGLPVSNEQGSHNSVHQREVQRHSSLPSSCWWSFLEPAGLFEEVHLCLIVQRLFRSKHAYVSRRAPKNVHGNGSFITLVTWTWVWEEKGFIGKLYKNDKSFPGLGFFWGDSSVNKGLAIQAEGPLQCQEPMYRAGCGGVCLSAQDWGRKK